VYAEYQNSAISKGSKVMTRSQKVFLGLVLFASVSLAQSRYASDVLALNPLGYWRLNGDANDATPNGSNGVLLNGVTFTGPGGGAPIADPNNQAASFNNAQDQYISMPTTASSPLFALEWNHPLTMMVWVKTTYTAASMVLLAKVENSGNFRGPSIFVDNGESGSVPRGSGRFAMQLESGVGSYILVETSASVTDGNWHFLVGTYDGSGAAGGVQLYIDGAAASTIISSNTLSSSTILNSVPVAIGSRDTGGAPFNGLLDEPAIFGNALTPAQVLQLGNDANTIQRVLPQLAFGGGWYTALYFTNTTTSAVSFSVNFTAGNGTPLTVPSVGGSSSIVNLAPRGTALIEAPNSGPLNQGYVSLSLPAGVTGYGVFRQSVAGIADQEGVVPLSSASSTTSTLIWDDTNNLVTSVAIVNPSSVPTTVSIVIRDATGTVLGGASVSLAAKGQTALILRTLPGLGAMAGNRGSADFTVPSGNVAVLGLRFNGAAFTSIPTADR
jgi:Concanavalin A-like lectin/glucanases superfamily